MWRHFLYKSGITKLQNLENKKAGMDLGEEGVRNPLAGEEGEQIPYKILIYQQKLKQLSSCPFPSVTTQTHKKSDMWMTQRHPKRNHKSNPN